MNFLEIFTANDLASGCLLAAGLNQALGSGLGVILGIGFVTACASLVAASLGGSGERSIAGRITVIPSQRRKET